jgi:hypothetical protein
MVPKTSITGELCIMHDVSHAVLSQMSMFLGQLNVDNWEVFNFVRIYQNLISCRHIARFCHPLQTKQNTKSRKYLCKNNACLQRGVTWPTDAIGFWKGHLGLPSHLLSPRQTVQELSDTTLYISKQQEVYTECSHFIAYVCKLRM